MAKRNYKEEARFLIQAVLQRRAWLYKLVDDEAEKHFKQNHPKTDVAKLKPAEQFSPYQKLIQGSKELALLFDRWLYISITEACYNTKNNIALPKRQWTNSTKQIYESLVETVATLLKQNKLKPLPK